MLVLLIGVIIHFGNVVSLTKKEATAFDDKKGNIFNTKEALATIKVSVFVYYTIDTLLVELSITKKQSYLTIAETLQSLHHTLLRSLSLKMNQKMHVNNVKLFSAVVAILFSECSRLRDDKK